MAKKNKGQNAQSTEASAQMGLGFIQTHVRQLMVACLVVVLVIVGIIVANSAINKRSAKAAEELYLCEQYFMAGNYENALNGDGVECMGFLSVANKYSSTKSGNAAKLYAGISYAQLGNYEDAKTYLEKFSPKKDAMISPAALGALGNVYVQLGENEKGAETLVKAAKKADNVVLSPIFLVQAGQIYESLGQTDKALEAYELVRSDYRASLQGSEIEKYIERAKLSK